MFFLFFFSVLSVGLQENFEEVCVSVVECPDLTQQPFMLAEQGGSIFQGQP